MQGIWGIKKVLKNLLFSFIFIYRAPVHIYRRAKILFLRQQKKK